MKRRILNILLICGMLLTFVGCSESSSVVVNVDDTTLLTGSQFGKFIKISSNLSYDVATGIVYIVNYTYMGNLVYTPYYASNGLPYKYDAETNTFEEIEETECKE